MNSLTKIFACFRDKPVLCENDVSVSGESTVDSRNESRTIGGNELFTWLPNLMCYFVSPRECFL